MKTIDLKGTLRKELGKKAAKQVRKTDSVPCVLYGEGDPIHFMGIEKELGLVVYTPHTYLINLNIDGKVHPAVMQDIQFHPVTDRILHMDFLVVKKGKPVSVSIPVQLEGFAAGVQQGGKLKLEKRRVTVRGQIETLPDELIIDVTPMEAGQSMLVRDLQTTGFTIMDPKNTVIASVKTTRASKGAAETAPEK